MASRWISVAPWLPDLAEAAPDELLDAVELLASDPGALADVFAEGGMFGSSPHVYLLWALERLAWSPDHLGRVVLALGRLATADPGGQLSNRPAKSLRMVLLPWHPATGATVAERVEALNLLFNSVADLAWECAASLLPQAHDVGDPFARPQWRRWAKDVQSSVTLGEYWSFQEELVDLLLQHVGTSGQRWKALLEASPQICKQNQALGDRKMPLPQLKLSRPS